MRMPFVRPLLALVALCSATLGSAATLNVTSPTNNDYLGRSNTVTFNITEADSRVTVTAVATAPNGTATTVSDDFNPNSDRNVSGTLSLGFVPTAQQGNYTLRVTAREDGKPDSVVTRNVIVDVVAPRFLELSPVNNSFTRSKILIRASVQEQNVDEWTVEFNGDQIFNVESTNEISFDYDITDVETDGAQSVRIVVTDLAGNTTERTISVTIDRRTPTVVIAFPTPNGRTTNGQDVNVLVDITDAATANVDRTGIEVTLRRPGANGAVFARVTLVSLRSTSGTTQRWTGRVRYQRNLFPSQYTVAARVVDRAGNRAVLQEVTARYGN